MLKNSLAGTKPVLEVDPTGREEFLRHFPVSHETMARLDRYAVLLVEWNAKFNLVAESTLPHVWRRHFLDSAQLIKFIPEDAKALTDLGSGAGFPGLVLGIMGIPHVHLIESIGKKADFLRAAIMDLSLDAIVHQERIESVRNIKFDILTARALKPLPKLLKLAKPLLKKDAFALLLKGKNADAELTESAKYWRFDYETFPSLSDHSGRVIKIGNLTKLEAGNRKNDARRKTE